MTGPSRHRNPVTVAITGASGGRYGLRLVQCLLEAGEAVYLMISEAGRLVLQMEEDVALPRRAADARRHLGEALGVSIEGLRVFGDREWTSPVASGSGAPARMVICPCTTGTLARVAAGTSDGLIERAADVVLKERHRLVLVVRETPFSEIHLENMLRLSRLGAVVLPANPGFYHRPQGVEALVDFVVARTLDQLGVDHGLTGRWGASD